MVLPDLIVEELGRQHDRSSFSCGVEELDRYIQEQARQDVRKSASTTFVLIREGSPKIMGYYTLSASGARLVDFPEPIAKKLPRYPLVPAILLGRLAVDKSHSGEGCGRKLIVDGMRRCLKIHDIGWAVLLVEAKDEKAATYYEKFGFSRFPKDKRRLYIPRKTISQLGLDL
ncbi:MAG: GNAT family N-acetyltransferase [Candidatus Omnitrophica bacterium]|nr:GNAT family N-acetyltransferase [Candidatus Omnitrophota bacterium]MCB9770720.1 GNAT family N-acetyltransferase [Candidatus Omnitrophota bacterium]MCB9783253.1 GNAT family N-acetyltransferase [Candidatus Omnitrophota bacterium]